MKKLCKFLIGVTAFSAAVAGILYLSKKRTSDDDEDILSDDFEDDSFDLDHDLDPVPEREYVSLTPEASSESEEQTPPEAQSAVEEDTSAEETAAEETTTEESTIKD